MVLSEIRCPRSCSGLAESANCNHSIQSPPRSPGSGGYLCFCHSDWHGWHIQRNETICWLWLVLLLSMGALTGWHARWGYFLAVSGALAMPFALAIVRQHWLGYALFIASLWPVALTLDNELFPHGKTARYRNWITSTKPSNFVVRPRTSRVVTVTEFSLRGG